MPPISARPPTTPPTMPPIAPPERPLLELSDAGESDDVGFGEVDLFPVGDVLADDETEVVEVMTWSCARSIVYEAAEGRAAASSLYVSFIIVALSFATGLTAVAQHMLIWLNPRVHSCLTTHQYLDEREHLQGDVLFGRLTTYQDSKTHSRHSSMVAEPLTVFYHHRHTLQPTYGRPHLCFRGRSNTILFPVLRMRKSLAVCTHTSSADTLGLSHLATGTGYIRPRQSMRQAGRSR